MTLSDIRSAIKAHVPESMLLPVWMARYGTSADAASTARFLATPHAPIGIADRWALAKQFYKIRAHVMLAHTEEEAIAFTEAILSIPPSVTGCVVEAGCYKGGSTAKFSLATRFAGRRLVVFDSFEGLPDNEERHDATIFGETPGFEAGKYMGTLDEVRSNIARFGAPEVCEFRKGWFSDTMPSFNEPVTTAFIDVDLVESTRTCLRYLYPLLVPGGVLFSQDGHLPLIIELLRDESFWRDDIGVAPPPMTGLGARKLVGIFKPA
jgi:O-methyltransferase